MPTSKLLIYVPTYNRVDLAITQLENLSKQVATTSRVRVIVSDNGSQTGDPESLRRWCEGKSNFKFRQNPSNLGAEANFLLAFCLAEKDEHLWILADDTPVKPDALKYLVENLDDEIDFVAFAPATQIERPPIYSWDSDGLGKAVNTFQWGLISSVVYNLKFVSSSISEGFRLHNTSYAHLAILFKALATNGTAQITWLETDRLHGENWADPASDYSFALAGSPLLYTLAPRCEKKKLSRSYLWHNSGAFIQAGTRHPLVFKQSRQLLLNFGGLPAVFAYTLGVLEYRFRKSTFGRRLDAIIERNPKLLAFIIKSGRLPFRIK